MEFVSTRGTARVPFREAIGQGLAPDGGLYMPSAWPRLAPPSSDTFAAVGRAIAACWMEGDSLAGALDAICDEALDLPVPVVPLADEGRLSVLELFHGPTAAFKDFGARFLAAALARAGSAGTRDILVATSGDTGGAVAAAFHRRPGVRVTLLFPEGRVSPLQQQQLTCWDTNVLAVAVQGTFDDCQQLVKAAFADDTLRTRLHLGSANSINVGRLLPQIAWYGAAALQCWHGTGEPLSFVVPSGNLGNAFGAIAARRLGFPIGDIVLAHNANRAVPDFVASGTWTPRPAVPTIANAMDVGDPSNLERFRALYPEVDALRAQISAMSVDDEAIRARIRHDAAAFGRLWCPHSATAAEVHARLAPARRDGRRWCLVATAHPAKFADTIEPLLGSPVPVPEALRTLRERPTRFERIAPRLEALAAVLTREALTDESARERP